MEPIVPTPREGELFGHRGVIFTHPDGREVFAHWGPDEGWLFCLPRAGHHVTPYSGVVGAPASILHYARKYWVPCLLQHYPNGVPQ